jgi:hypothetical protein
LGLPRTIRLAIARFGLPRRRVRGLIAFRIVTAPSGEIDRLRADVVGRLDAVEREVMLGYVDKQLWTAMRSEIATRRPAADGTWFNHYSNMYAAGQAMRIRRLADDSRDRPDSLWWLIERVRRNPAIAGRQALVEHIANTYPDNEWLVESADRRFTAEHGEGDVPSGETLVAWQDRLRHQFEAVLEFADRHVAHLDPRGARQPVTYGHIHEALDHVAAVCNDVNMLLRDKNIDDWDPMVHGDWQEVFRPALFPIDPSAYTYPDLSGYV